MESDLILQGVQLKHIDHYTITKHANFKNPPVVSVAGNAADERLRDLRR